MNSKYTDSRLVSVTGFNAAAPHRPSALFAVSRRDEPDYWTPLMSAFLVLCMLSALAICSWQVDGWKSTHSIDAQPAVATDGFVVNGQHTF